MAGLYIEKSWGGRRIHRSWQACSAEPADGHGQVPGFGAFCAGSACRYKPLYSLVRVRQYDSSVMSVVGMSAVELAHCLSLGKSSGPLGTPR